jgi:glycosyltransferase involved in cell wall biosynthesis
MSHVTYIVTDPMTVKIYLKPQFKALVNRKWRVSVICGGNKALLPDQEELEGVSVYHVPMRREIDPIRDIFALGRLLRLLRRLDPVVVNAGTPKAGLIGMIASRLAHIPVRIYHLHGLRLETATGCKRRLFLLTERAACWCSQKVLCVSPSLKKRAVELGICGAQKLAVLGSGSCVGVDIADYVRTPERLAAAAALRAKLQVPSDAPVLGFIGRLTKDKGIMELLDAFALIREKLCRAYLLLVGPFEDGDRIPEQARREIVENPYIRHVDWTDDPRPYFHVMNVFVLPTYREGLPGVLLEATAAETPIVATRATGVVDVVVDEETGLLSPIGDARSLADNGLRVLLNPSVGRELTRRARRKIEAEFSREEVLQHLELFYRECIHCGVSGEPEFA